MPGLGQSEDKRWGVCATGSETFKRKRAGGDARRIPVAEQNLRVLVFRKRFFPQATEADWSNWRWQLRNRIKTLERLEHLVKLTDDEREGISLHSGSLPVAITPHYATLLDENDPSQPIRRSVIPVAAEHLAAPGESADPLGEDEDSPVHGLVHRYPDRALFIVTEFCSTYCRYCTRSRMVGKKASPCKFENWEKALSYIEATPAIRDVLLSGGDPLTLTNDKLEMLLSRLRRIPHVELIRIGTKAPVVLPQRITPALTSMLKRYHPLWMSIHFTHPDELTPETVRACERLADAGIPLGSQTVLLAGINDTVETMKSLLQGLLRARVRPYYLYQCDPILGSSHFRTPVSKGLEIIQGLRGHTTGYAVPSYVIDAPGGGGKVPLLPENVVGREDGYLLLRNYEGNVYRYPDSPGVGTDVDAEQGAPCR
ncbi:MAG: KamA family radical SAM protein [Candidatus Abyssobacteria bacterium SURF_5]|uniref:L-lysine 2,3-aminomutase n=1 Tax=Abyssobacteria bacterium (strain SURF_5) TaxID=2093360 RepID=A0A3A4PBX3_ABYX5|nr:MAG: KamA family radical SAM protein [Candidatus Abyssubacteria bacterium SURF_5]